jgi:hypothetical protein
MPRELFTEMFQRKRSLKRRARARAHSHTHTHKEEDVKEIISPRVAEISIQELQTIFNYMLKKFQA